MASDAFFPFPDCVEIAHDAGVKSVIQPGGSIKDELSIQYCNENKMAMVVIMVCMVAVFKIRLVFNVDSKVLIKTGFLKTDVLKCQIGWMNCIC